MIVAKIIGLFKIVWIYIFTLKYLTNILRFGQYLNKNY